MEIQPTPVKEEEVSGLNAAEESPSTTSATETDGIVSSTASVLPPASLQTFIANGNSSTAVFEIVAARHIFIENAYFSGNYPLIQYITAEDIGVAVNSPSGQMGFTGVSQADANGIKLRLSVFYSTVDINTSGSVATLNLTALQYKTDDELYLSFSPAKVIPAQKICIVNNIPQILFQNPANDTLQNGYTQIAKIELTGDTAWTLRALPLNLWSPFLRTISKSKLIIKSGNEKVAESDEIQLNINSRIETVIHFEGGFKHAPGEKEILRIYADTPALGMIGHPIVTIMYPLSSFVWNDGLGTKIPGNKNVLYYKEETGRSIYDETA